MLSLKGFGTHVLAAFAAADDVVAGTTETIEWFTLIVGFAGGLALFLYGMDRMTDSLRVVVGDKARDILGRLTKHRVSGLLTGAGVTAVVQSSSVTTVLLVGFVTAGLMAFVQTVPVIFGSNIGTTVTAQIIAFDVTAWALVFVAIGFLASAIGSTRRNKARGTALLGLGLIFLGMGLMGEAMRPLRTYEPFIDAMGALDSVFLAILVGALFTALVQSSSATTAVVIVLAGEGLISLQAGVALVLGANIGTTFTAVLAAIGKPTEAQRVAGAHVVFNVAGVLIWIPFIGLLVSWVETIGGGLQREIANAHTIFNVVNALIFLPFTAQFAHLIERIIPERPPSGAVQPKYIDEALLRTPSLALAKARMETLRMAGRVQGMLVSVLPAVLDGDIDELDAVRAADDEVDELHGLILDFLSKVSRERLSDESSAELVDLLEATDALEAIGDIIVSNLVRMGEVRIENSIEVSTQTRRMIESYHRSVLDAFQLALVALTQKDEESARGVSAMKKVVRSEEAALRDRYTERLTIDEPNRVATYRFEVDVMTHLKRIYYFTRRIARVAIPDTEQAKVGNDPLRDPS